MTGIVGLRMRPKDGIGKSSPEARVKGEDQDVRVLKPLTYLEPDHERARHRHTGSFLSTQSPQIFASYHQRRIGFQLQPKHFMAALEQGRLAISTAGAGPQVSPSLSKLRWVSARETRVTRQPIAGLSLPSRATGSFMRRVSAS